MHDPLYKWSLDPNKRNRLQPNEEYKQEKIKINAQKQKEENDNEHAQRALHILRQKFQGTDNEQLNVISVEGQVNRLILQAVDHNNLCKMFHGWCAWM